MITLIVFMVIFIILYCQFIPGLRKLHCNFHYNILSVYTYTVARRLEINIRWSARCTKICIWGSVLLFWPHCAALSYIYNNRTLFLSASRWFMCVFQVESRRCRWRYEIVSWASWGSSREAKVSRGFKIYGLPLMQMYVKSIYVSCEPAVKTWISPTYLQHVAVTH